jgi:hypothetical protein
MRRVAVPALIVLTGSLALEVAYGVSLGEALLYIAYELCFIVIPGWLVYLALSRRPGGALRQLAIGWALGYVLEILAFMLTAATGTRGLFVVYPLVVGVVAGMIVARRGAFTALAEDEPRLPSRFGWLLAAVCLGAVVYVAFSYFPGAPLPGTESVTYFLDYPRWIALAADAKHHWPIMDPSVSGEPLPYHYFVNVHLAAASQVTGLDLPLVFFRLFILPLVVLTVLLLVVAGQSFARSAAVGLIAACIAFFIGELRLDASDTFLAHTPFFGLFFTYLFRSPSFLLGLVMFVPLMILLGERITAKAQTTRPGDWLLLALFIVGASDAKVSILPLVFASLLLFAGWKWLAERRVPAAVWGAAATVLLVAGSVWALQYRGHSSNLVVDPFASFDQMPAVALIKGDLMGHLAAFPGKETVLSAGGILLGSFGLLAAPLVGIVWILRRRGRRLGAGKVWLFSLLGAGLLLAFTVSEPGTQNQLYFLFYGLVAGYVLSAEGLRMAWQSRPSLSGRWKRLVVLGLAILLTVVGLMGAPTWLDLFSGPRSDALTYMFRYGGLLLALALLYAAARRWLGPTRWAAGAVVSAAVLAVGALATPLDNLEPALTDPAAAEENLGKEMTPGLHGALTWVRDTTPADSVVAVNNQWIDDANTIPLEFIYSGFSERRVFLEGWAYSQRSREIGYATLARGVNPFAGRLRLNQAAFTQANARALRAMSQRYGVRYLIVDRFNGYPADVGSLRRFGRVVHRGPGALVLELR